MKQNLIAPIPKPGRAQCAPRGYGPVNVLTSLAKVVAEAQVAKLGGAGVDLGQFAHKPGVTAENVLIEMREEVESVKMRGYSGLFGVIHCM